MAIDVNDGFVEGSDDLFRQFGMGVSPFFAYEGLGEGKRLAEEAWRLNRGLDQFAGAQGNGGGCRRINRIERVNAAARQQLRFDLWVRLLNRDLGRVNAVLFEQGLQRRLVGESRKDADLFALEIGD